MKNLLAFLIGLAALFGATQAHATCGAGASACFWVGGTGNWDGVTTTHWASSSNGAGGAGTPATTDTVTFDGNSGGGTVTVTATVTVGAIAGGAFTGTLALNGQTINAPSFQFSGSGTRTLTCGTATLNLSGTSGNVLDIGTTTNLSGVTCGSAALNFTATSPTGVRTPAMGGTTVGSWGAVTVSGPSSPTFAIYFNTSGNQTWSSLTISQPMTVVLNTNTITLSNGPTFNGTSSFPINFTSISANSTNKSTIAMGANSGTATNVVFFDMAFTGANGTCGTPMCATNSWDGGNNSGATITAPTSGGGRGIIGG